jgi:hypothetical protein
MIRVALPYHLQNLARTGREVQIVLEGRVTVGSLLDALEREYPVLRGTIRDVNSGQRRDFVRFFVCGQDYSLEPWDTQLPADILNGREPFRIVGAMSGG